MIGITYHKDYSKYDLGLDHPLIGDKPKKTIEYLKKKNLLDNIEIFEPKAANYEDLIRVHSKNYVDLVKKLSENGGILSHDTPAPKGIYKYATIPTGGSILCGKKLMENYRVMINPLGGFHHASKSYSSGFCFFNDIAVAIEYLKEKYALKKFAIIDLDVHHANGTQDIYFADPDVLNISVHQDGSTLYPGTGAIEKIGKEKARGYNINLPLPPGTGNKAYMYAFTETIPILINQFNPQMIIYQSGVDTHYSDPLADLKTTYQIFYHLAKKIKNLSAKTCNKLFVPMGGGYNSQSSIFAYYNIVSGIVKNKDFIVEDDKFENEQIDEVKKRVKKLKILLKPYWDFD